MDNEIIVFNNGKFGTVRTLAIDGEPWFVGKDVAEALGYAKPRSAVSKWVETEDKGVAEMATPSGTQKMTIVNESGLYSLILSSKFPSAKKFKHWITSEVIPSIRKHGGYISGQETMSDIELLSRAVLIANSQIEEKNKLIQEQQNRIEEMKPKEEFADAVSGSKTSILVRELAKLLNQNGYDT